MNSIDFSTSVVHGYSGEDIILTLPADLTTHGIDYLSLYCISFTMDFGSINIPLNLNVPPHLDRKDALRVSPHHNIFRCHDLVENGMFPNVLEY